LQAKEGSQGGVAFFIVLYSLLLEPLQVILDNSAKKVLVPVSNKRQLLDVPGEKGIFLSLSRGNSLRAASCRRPANAAPPVQRITWLSCFLDEIFQT
jgi:hypothetical protein